MGDMPDMMSDDEIMPIGGRMSGGGMMPGVFPGMNHPSMMDPYGLDPYTVSMLGAMENDSDSEDEYNDMPPRFGPHSPYSPPGHRGGGMGGGMGGRMGGGF